MIVIGKNNKVSFKINEGDAKNKSNPIKDNIKFIIWERPEKKVRWIKSNTKYQKIEYKFEDVDHMIFVQFLLGFVEEENTWKLWAGKIGGVSYDDDPYCKLNTEKFAEAIIKACDKIVEIIDKIKEEPTNYIQYYREAPSADKGDDGEDGDEGGDDNSGGDLL